MKRFILVCGCLFFSSLAASENLETPWEYFDCTGEAATPVASSVPQSHTVASMSHQEVIPVSHHTEIGYAPLRGYVGQTLGRGIGYNKPYTSVGLFYMPRRYSCCVLPFLDMRLHKFNHGKFAYNLGGGLRFLVPSLNRVMGINSYYDYRDGKRDWHRLGIGFELLGPCFDIRINGYFPVGSHTHESHPKRFCFPGGFFASCTRKTEALRGVDGEICTSLQKLCPCWCRCWDIYMAVGAYAYPIHCGHNANGGKFRLGISFCDSLLFEFRLTDDRYFGTRVQGFFALSFPLYICQENVCCEPGCCDLCLRTLADIPVQREEIIGEDRGRCCWKTNF